MDNYMQALSGMIFVQIASPKGGSNVDSNEIREKEQQHGEDKMSLSICYCNGCSHSKTLKTVDHRRSNSARLNFLELDTKGLSERAIRKLTRQDGFDENNGTAPAIKMVCYGQVN